MAKVSAGFRMQEYIGDAVYELVLRETFIQNWHTKHDGFRKICFLRANKNMAKIAMNLGLAPVCENKGNGYANALEVKIYDIYKSGGIDAAKIFFNLQILPHYNEELNQVKELPKP